MSRRNDYQEALSWIQYGGWCGIALGISIFTFGVVGPPITPLIIAGILLFADGVWVMSAPLSAGFYPLLAALLLLAWVLTTRVMPDASIYEVTSLIVGLVCVVATNFWRLKRGDLADVLSTPPTAEELKEEQFEDLVEDIRSSSMDGDRDHVEFITWSLLSRTQWEGRLRDEDVVLTSADATRPLRTRFAPAPAALVLPKADFEIRNARKMWLRHAFKARFRMGDRLVTGRIGRDAFKRYTRWKKHHSRRLAHLGSPTS